jgi:hypothetical protein
LIGWVFSLVVILYGAAMTQSYLSMRNDPLADVAPLWGFLALSSGLLLLLCGCLGVVYRRRFGMPWPQAFGFLLSEAGAAIALGALLDKEQYSIAGLLLGRKNDVEAILASFDHVRDMLGWFNITLPVSLILLAAFTGYKADSRSRRSEPPT